MFREEVAARPLGIWLLCAMTAPVAQLLAGFAPLPAVWLAILCTAVLWLGLAGGGEYGKWVSALQMLWLVIVMAVCARFAGETWPMGRTGKAAGLVLLGLAAWSAQKGPAAAARTAGILLLLVSIGYGIVLTAGWLQLEPAWMNGHRQASPGLLLFVFLMPGAAACLPRQMPGKEWMWLIGIPIFFLLATLAACGSVHPMASGGPYAFLEMCRSLRLFGFAERFEALVCAMLTVGWFSLLSLMLNCLGACSYKLLPGRASICAWVAAGLAGGLMLIPMSVSYEILSIGAVFFWGLLPIFCGRKKIQKNSEKSKKSP